ncbi:uncharacterized protein FOMMEDRAFT_101080 [Fomitiporia mediterranea MF3/22]|uniref:uncharacterized protein n=1 Tax=Fomitiporia mediterranea (strain MF3/22) TaxID=694068 RepID=UPI0004408A0A|nr:uncharacterized protein FOMMEDRAFT_101080 [Fomitiporia mediterranea MF3/22]EJD07690.1 hypothetical protein FOMMEDRAFT_101080 [Fomitiporia mediterranea MF3/22]
MVSSRSKSAAEAAANRRTTRSAAASGVGPAPPDVSMIEQQETKSAPKKAAPKKSVAKPIPSKPPPSTVSSAAKSVSKGKKKGGNETYCNCDGEDDGSPMVKCEGPCQKWYHFKCVELDEETAGEIEKYYCRDCEASTGLKTVMDFEGPDAFVEPNPSPPVTKKARSKTPVEQGEEVVESPEESDGAGSEDDYVAEPVGKRNRSGKRPARHTSFESDKSESDDEEDDDADGGRRRRGTRSGGALKRLKKASASPAPESSSALKRRGSTAQQPAAKRSKTAESPHDDAIRKYCLTKLDEIIRPMFEEYRTQVDPQGEKVEEQVKTEENKDEEPSTSDSIDKVKDDIDQKVKAFVYELERCMMETYAEPDKTGKPSAGRNYKERFRMLQFNLPKPDRVALRQGIASGRITPAQLNVMSSTDLADEQTKHEIELAEKEALEHSILQRVIAPRAKITHKGYETIEDVSGQRASDLAKEEEEQRMEMEKLEREKLARLRSLSQAEGSPMVEQSPLSATFPKASSPAVSNAPRSQVPWGAPPPPPHQPQQGDVPPESPSSSRPSVRPLFVPSMSSDYASTDQGLSLADIINIDDDVSAQDTSQSNPQLRMSAQANAEAGPSSSPIITSPSGPSPFAPSKPAQSPNRSAFDLNSLWTGAAREEEQTGETESNSPGLAVGSSAPPESAIEEQGDAMEIDSNNEDDEEALDAILQQSAPVPQSDEPPAPQPAPAVESLPDVWSGQVSMPRESFDTLTIDVTCKQVGGRTLEPMSGYWQTLFTSPQARIDGRVPTAQAVQYLVSIRMNSSKELIVVNFLPRTDQALASFNELIDFLIGKDRHALVFPWGTQPKPQAPGRELYIIPLLKDQPLPEFIELLDDHCLPKERTSNALLGAFVLNKGKLVAATPPPASVPPVPAPGSVPTPFPSIPNIPFQMPNIPIPPTVPASHSPNPHAQPVNIDQAALAAEVASLTQEQISLMIRHLSQSVPLAASMGIAGQNPVGTSVPGVTSVPAPPVLPSTYPIPGMPPFPPTFPPAHQQSPQPPSGQHSPPRQYSPPHPPGQYGDYHSDEREDRHRDFGRDGHSGRGGRGWSGDRGRRGGRGRGKRHYDDKNGRTPPADRGWGGRGRGGGPR